jgi:peptidoglycan/xylan/chitin deacetylase (PgdA/CDA1 family)
MRILSIVLLAMLVLFPVLFPTHSGLASATTSLTFYVKNVNGNLVTDGNAVVKRYSSNWVLIDQMATDSSGKAVWTNIPVDTYNFETYYNGKGGQEYWGDVSITLGSSATTFTFTRFMPFCLSVWIGDTNGNAKTSFKAGETVRTRFTIKNNCNYALSCKVNGIWDRDQLLPWDFNQTTASSSVGGTGGTLDLTLDYTIPANASTGTMRLAYWVWTQLLNGNTIVTDSWNWTTYTINVSGNPKQTKPFVALQFDVESDSNNMATGLVSQPVLNTIHNIGDLLKSNNLTGTFFVQGACFDNPTSGANFANEINLLMVRNEIESHFYSHLENMSSKSSSIVLQELNNTEKAAGMKFYGARVPYFDISNSILSQLAANGYIYDSDVWINGDNTPYTLASTSPVLYEFPWRCSDYDTQYSVIKGVLDSYVASGSNMTIVLHPEYITNDWTGFSQLIQAIATYKSNNNIVVMTSLQTINTVFHISQPDLSINPADIKSIPSGTPSSNSVVLRAVIHNIGGSDANNFIARFYDGNPSLGGSQIGTDIQIGQLKAGLATAINTTWTATTGTHTVYVSVDPTNTVAEKDKTNNLAYSNIAINISSQPSTPPSSSNVRFSPTINGFQFGNNIPKKTVSYSDACNALNSASWAMSIPSQVIPLLALFSVCVNQIQLGNCFGMSYTAKYYYENPASFAQKYPGYENMYAVSMDDASPEIMVNQFPGQEVMQPYLFNLVMTYLGLNSLNDQAQWMMNEINNNRVVQLYLTKRDNDPFFFHSILVFDYELNGNELLLKVYDPNHSGETRTILLSKDQNGNFVLERTGESGDVVSEYDITNIGTGEFTNVDWNSLLDHINELVQTVWDLLPKTGGSFLGFKLACPANLLIKASNGSRVGYDWTTRKVVNEISEAFYSGNSTEPQVILVPNPKDESYNVMLSGVGNGAYTLTIERFNNGTLVGVPVSANGQIKTGDVKQYTLQLTEGAQPSITEMQAGTIDYTPYIIFAIAIAVAGIAIGVGLGKRKTK